MKRRERAIPIEAVVEHGQLKPLQPLRLKEHQHVWVTIVSDDPTRHDLARLASKSPSFQFLADPTEDCYSLQDGQPV